MHWYEINNVSSIASPSLIIYKDRLEANIRKMTAMFDDVNRLRPHVKTHKMKEVSELLMAEGVRKFKCATLAEATMLAEIGAKEVHLAYTLVGPDINTFVNLVKTFEETNFSFNIDDHYNYEEVVKALKEKDAFADVYIDVDVGMSRTGISPEYLGSLVELCSHSKYPVVGLHIYDGHITDKDLTVRLKRCEEAYAPIKSFREREEKRGKYYKLIAGGSLSFPYYKDIQDVECSPGTFVFWDKGYFDLCAEQPFEYAALVLGRVISRPSEGGYCVDVGYKAIASENPIERRLYALIDGEIVNCSILVHSEEHLVIHLPKNELRLGDPVFFIPHHICPTVALYDTAQVVVGNVLIDKWKVVRCRI